MQPIGIDYKYCQIAKVIERISLLYTESPVDLHRFDSHSGFDILFTLTFVIGILNGIMR